MDITENELFVNYPKVALSADVYGFTYEDIKELMTKIESDLPASSYFKTSESKQNSLKAIFTRLNLKRDDFYHHLKMVKMHELPDELLEKDCGKYNLKLYKALLR